MPLFQFFGPIVPECIDGICSFCHLFQLLDNLIKFATTIAPIIALAFIVYGSFIIITSGGSSSRFAEGKKIITRAVIGVVIVLCAWLIVSTIFLLLTGSHEGTLPLPWYKISC